MFTVLLSGQLKAELFVNEERTAELFVNEERTAERERT
jgi:hypothetical protein